MDGWPVDSFPRGSRSAARSLSESSPPCRRASTDRSATPRRRAARGRSSRSAPGCSSSSCCRRSLPRGPARIAARSTACAARGIPWWMLAGGAAGALTVATQGLAVAIIGVSLFTVGVVAGQALYGLVLDRVGYGPAGVVAVTVPRLIGGALALGAVGSRSPATDCAASRCGCSCCRCSPASASRGSRRRTGGCVSGRHAPDGDARQLRRRDDPARRRGAVHVAHRGIAGGLPDRAWLYLGGAIGVLYIFLSAALVAHTGVLLLGLGVVVGQLAHIDRPRRAVAGAGGPGRSAGARDGPRRAAVGRGRGRPWRRPRRRLRRALVAPLEASAVGIRDEVMAGVDGLAAAEPRCAAACRRRRASRAAPRPCRARAPSRPPWSGCSRPVRQITPQPASSSRRLSTCATPDATASCSHRGTFSLLR